MQYAIAECRLGSGCGDTGAHHFYLIILILSIVSTQVASVMLTEVLFDNPWVPI